MAVGDSQDWSCAASGCTRRSFFVRFLYVSKELLIINWKLKVDVDVEAEADAV
jgi:hypothetical protein